MNRDIKFRVWSEKNKKMLEIQKHSFKTGKSMPYGYNIAYDFGELMQYTGLKDENEKEIYEGDILSIKIYSRDKVIVEGKTVVEFKDGCFGVIWGHDKAFLSLNSFFKAKFEVIGNIYENPELLRGEK
ncbi:YopX family protein [Clostridium perfringens]|uniref:YopX family protein n=1 Tax=Clostridium perfringens TaxID=1502 RepID=UPI000D7100D3|nr:YopX family protein [Clostridium perfringens]PWX24643.1 DNA-packaging protein [Clostridium perfringens]